MRGHKLTITRPGQHGADSVTAKCECHEWSRTLITRDTPPSTTEEVRLARSHEEHARDHYELVAYSEALSRQPFVKASERSTRYRDYGEHAGGASQPAAPARGEHAFEVVAIRAIDGAAFLFPRGYRRGARRQPLREEGSA